VAIGQGVDPPIRGRNNIPVSLYPREGVVPPMRAHYINKFGQLGSPVKGHCCLPENDSNTHYMCSIGNK